MLPLHLKKKKTVKINAHLLLDFSEKIINIKQSILISLLLYIKNNLSKRGQH